MSFSGSAEMICAIERLPSLKCISITAASAANLDDANGLTIAGATVIGLLDLDTGGAVEFTGLVNAGSLDVDTTANGGSEEAKKKSAP